MADNDYLCIYRQFFEEFAETFMDEYRPLRCNVYSLSLDELLGEVMVSTVNFLSNRNCPRGLVVPLTKIIVEEFLNEARKRPEEVDTPLKLNNKTLDKISEVCLRYTDNEKLSSLPGPVQETLFSTHSTKHMRRQMEDRLICLPRFNSMHNIRSNTEAGFYGIFDGHGGVNAACYVVSHLHQFLAESEHYPEDPVKAFRSAYEKTEFRYNLKEENSGTTALVILHQPVEKRLIVSWVGDSLAMLVTEDSYVMLVDPHKPERSDEKKRIEDLGGFIAKAHNIYRVNGGLAVSRALGDKKLKPHVSAEPEIRVLNLTGSEHFIVMGCDGLWDVAEPQQVIETVYFEVKKAEGRIDTVARRLVDLAKENNSTDNISVIVIFLTDPIEICKKSVDASGHRPKILLQDGVIMESNFQKNEISSLNDPGMNGIYEANGNHFGDHMKNESDEDFGPETDVDAIDDIMSSPKNLNHFANEGWEKTQAEENAEKLIEFAARGADNEIFDRDDNDDGNNVKFSDDFAGSLINRDGENRREQELSKEMRSDLFSVDNSNPFECPNKNNMSEMLDLPSNGRDNNKYVEEVNLQKEDLDNFKNSNFMEQPFEMKSETDFARTEESHEMNKDPFGFENIPRTESKDMFSPSNQNADDFFNSDAKFERDEMMKPMDAAANAGGGVDDVLNKSTPEPNNEEFEGFSLNVANNDANTMITNTIPGDEMEKDVFKMNEPEPDMFKESLAMDNVGNPPIFTSVNEPLDVERISREFYPTDEDDARREDEPSSELISPSAPTLEGEARDDIIAESGGEVEDSDEEWKYFKGGEREPAENKSFDSVLHSNESSSELEKSAAMNSPLNPDAAEFIPVSTKPISDEYDVNTTPVKALPRDLSDIVASSPNWANMENVNLPEESAFLCEIKSRPSNIFDEMETPQKQEETFGDFKPEGIAESPVSLGVTSPVETEKREEKVAEEPHGIALASDMTSSFIDPSTMSNQDESPVEKVENFVAAPVEEPAVAQEIAFSEKIPEKQEFGDFETQMSSKLPDLLSPASVEGGVSSPVSPIPETPKSTEVEAPVSPQPEVIASEVTPPLVPEVQATQPISPSPVTQTTTPQTTPDSKESVEVVPAVAEVPEKVVEKEENKTVSPEVIGAAAATAVAAAAATAVAATTAVKKTEDSKKDVKKAAPKTAPTKTVSRTSATTKPALNGTKTSTPTKKPAASTPPSKTAATARTVNTTSTTSASPASKTAASRVSSVSKTAPKPMTSSVTSTLNKVQPRTKSLSTTTATSKVSSPSKPIVSSTTTKPATAPVKTTTRVSGVTATSTAPKPKPRVPSAPVDKKTSPVLNGDSKSTVKRTEITSKKPSTTTTTTTTRVSLSARPATAPAKTITKTTVTTTRTLTAKPRTTTASGTTTTTTTTTSTVTAASKVSSGLRKVVNDKQAKEVANRITSKSTASKTNGTLPGKTGTTTTTTVTKTRKTLSTTTTTPSKTEKDNKTENKAEKIVDQTVEIIQSENDKSLIVDNNEIVNLVNSIASN